MVEEGVLHDWPLLNGRKRPGTYHLPHSFAAAAAAAIASSSTAEMAMRWNLMAGDSALSLHIASNTVNEDNDKLGMSYFKYR